MARTDDFEYDLTTDFESYVSSLDKTKAGPKILVRGSQNVYKKLSGTIASRFGLKRRGQADGTLAGVKSSYEWATSNGVTRVLRIANSKLQVESTLADGSTIVEYDLMTSLTLTRFVFDSWWNDTNKKDLLIFVMGDSNTYAWDGGIGKISSTTSNSVVLTSDATLAGFAPAGDITINGNSYSYSSISGSTLVGVSGDPTGEPNGSIVLSKVIVNSNSPATGYDNDFIRIINNRLHVGSYTSQLVYISDQSDYTDFSVPSPRTPGSAELLTLDDCGRGIAVQSGNANIFGGTSNLYVVSYTSLTVGSVLTEQTDVSKVQLGNKLACLAHEFIDILAENIIYLDQNNQLRAYGIFRNIVQAKAVSLSQQIHDELAEQDFTGGQLRVVSGNLDDTIYITSPISGTVYFYQERSALDTVGNVVAERLWHPPQIWNASRIAVVDGVEYAYSNANPQMYQIWNTDQWHDDSPSGEPLPYDCHLFMSYKRVNAKGGPRRQGLGNFTKTFFEGYMPQGVDLLGNIYSDYQGGSGIQTLVINSKAAPAHFYSNTNPPSLGSAPLGSAPLGDGLSTAADDQDLVPKFYASPGIDGTNCFEYQIEVYTTEVDSRWEILSLGVNITESEQQSTFLNN